jgi:hypothetical protein
MVLKADGGFAGRLNETVAPRFAAADVAATRAAQLFRNGYVVNYAFAALAVLLSLLGLALPAEFKPVLVAVEFVVIAAILLVTRTGQKADWHRQWLGNRHLAERMRCLALSARLGELGLRIDGDVAVARGSARNLGLPDATVDAAYLTDVSDALTAMIDDQMAYLKADAHIMHRLDHRLHRLGLLLFAGTAVACAGLFGFELYYHLAEDPRVAAYAHAVVITATIASAALPAIGAAIYGIRMQGDFSGTARRNEALFHHLASLRKAMADEAGTGPIHFDVLKRRVNRATDLLVADVDNWRQSYEARPLSLPG